MIQFIVGLLIICFAAGLGWFGKNLAQEGWEKWKHPEVANTINEVKAEDTAARQLRAYVSVGPLIVKEKFPKEISFVAKNTGQTPAYDLSSHLNFEKTGPEVGLPDGLGFPIREGFTFGCSVATLGSNGEIEFTFPVHLDDLTKVQNGKIGLFYYGHISYKDISKKDHVSKLCYQYTGFKQGDAIVHEFIMCENHNDAD